MSNRQPRRRLKFLLRTPAIFNDLIAVDVTLVIKMPGLSHLPLQGLAAHLAQEVAFRQRTGKNIEVTARLAGNEYFITCNDRPAGSEQIIAVFCAGRRSRSPEFLRPDAVAQGNADAQAEQAGQRYGQNGLAG